MIRADEQQVADMCLQIKSMITKQHTQQQQATQAQHTHSYSLSSINPLASHSQQQPSTPPPASTTHHTYKSNTHSFVCLMVPNIDVNCIRLIEQEGLYGILRCYGMIYCIQ